MAIQFTGQKRWKTGNNNLLSNQATCSISYWVRYDGTPAAGAGAFAVASTSSADSGYGEFFSQWAGASGSQVKLQTTWNSATANVMIEKLLLVGTVYHIAATYDSTGSQKLYVNGTASNMGSLTGNTIAYFFPFQLGGWDFTPTSSAVWTIEDVAIWNGYILTASDVAALLTGGTLPPAIGGSATQRARWTCAGTGGATVTAGDPGIADAFGGTGCTMVSTNGTGTAVYTSTLLPPQSITDPVTATVASDFPAAAGLTFNLFFGGGPP